jgi:hypothetical protein
MKTKTVEIPLYFEKFKIVVGDFDSPEYEARVLFEKNMMVLYIKPQASPEIVAHEAVHIANHTFKNCGIRIDVDNDEPQAYLIGWIVKQISNTLKRFNTQSND